MAAGSRWHELIQRLRRVGERGLAHQRTRLERGFVALEQQARRRLERAADALMGARSRLPAAAERELRLAAERLAARALRVRLADPVQVLARGYAWLRGPDGRTVTRSADVRSGDRVTAQLSEGQLEVVVKTVRSPTAPLPPAPDSRHGTG
jgi:exodeoxyribonuclease VII large subunit